MGNASKLPHNNRANLQGALMLDIRAESILRIGPSLIHGLDEGKSLVWCRFVHDAWRLGSVVRRRRDFFPEKFPEKLALGDS